MRLRSDEHYIERGMKIQPTGWAGRYWRSGGFLILLTTYLLIAFRWVVALTVWTIMMSVALGLATWFVAAMLDIREKKE